MADRTMEIREPARSCSDTGPRLWLSATYSMLNSSRLPSATMLFA